ncbi:MAG: endonuclease III, partial [Porticoccaceae bacterium]
MPLDKMQAQGLLDMASSVTLLTMQNDTIHRVMAVLREECCQWVTPAVSVIAEQLRSPYTVLISCIISLRTKDAVTAAASARLFERARDPAAMLQLNQEEIASLIFPAGFYRKIGRA